MAFGLRFSIFAGALLMVFAFATREPRANEPDYCSLQLLPERLQAEGRAVVLEEYARMALLLKTENFTRTMTASARSLLKAAQASRISELRRLGISESEIELRMAMLEQERVKQLENEKAERKSLVKALEESIEVTARRIFREGKVDWTRLCTDVPEELLSFSAQADGSVLFNLRDPMTKALTQRSWFQGSLSGVKTLPRSAMAKAFTIPEAPVMTDDGMWRAEFTAENMFGKRVVGQLVYLSDLKNDKIYGLNFGLELQKLGVRYTGTAVVDNVAFASAKSRIVALSALAPAIGADTARLSYPGQRYLMAWDYQTGKVPKPVGSPIAVFPETIVGISPGLSGAYSLELSSDGERALIFGPEGILSVSISQQRILHHWKVDVHASGRPASQGSISPDGKKAAVSVKEADGSLSVMILDLETGQSQGVALASREEAIPGLTMGMPASLGRPAFNRSGDLVAVLSNNFHSSTRPSHDGVVMNFIDPKKAAVTARVPVPETEIISNYLDSKAQIQPYIEDDAFILRSVVSTGLGLMAPTQVHLVRPLTMGR